MKSIVKVNIISVWTYIKLIINEVLCEAGFKEKSKMMRDYLGLKQTTPQAF